MADGITIKMEGIDDLRRALEGAAKEIRKKAVRGALRLGAQVIQREARSLAPVLSAPVRNRKPGTIKKNIVVRASKVARKEGNEGVYVSVKPLSSAKIRKFKTESARKGDKWSGSQNPDDPYYWWWVEFGHRSVKRAGKESGTADTVYQQRLKDGRVVTRKRKYSLRSLTGRRRASTKTVPGRFFMTRAANKGAEAVQVFMDSVIPQIEKLNKKAGNVR